MHIRFAKISDVSGIADIHATAWCNAFGTHVTPEILERMRTKDRIPMTTAAVLEQRTWVAEDAGKILGFATIAGTETAPELKLLYIHPDHQRHGIGQQLFQAVRNHFKANGIDTFTLWTMKNYPAADRFYTRLGGHPTGNTLRLKINLDTQEYRFKV